ncbi:MAG: glycerol uptake facilitator protein [Arenicella sp.]|jgi:glycerol uptake facilitator protein
MRGLFGEFLGTFILVFVGCGSVAWSILIQDLTLWQIAPIWGGGVCLAIIVSSPFSKAHLNPAVTIGFWLSADFERKNLLSYFTGQLLGAFVAAAALYLIFHSYIGFQTSGNARFLGEYYTESANFDIWAAMGVEAIGTFLLMFGIYLIIKIDVKRAKLIHPLLIGVLLAILIFFLAPYTQAGFNPARDFMPRLFSFFAGWDMAFSLNGIGWLLVYVLAPIFGASTAAVIYKRIVERRG